MKNQITLVPFRFSEVRLFNLVGLISMLWFVSRARLVPEKMHEKGRKRY